MLRKPKQKRIHAADAKFTQASQGDVGGGGVAGRVSQPKETETQNANSSERKHKIKRAFLPLPNAWPDAIPQIKYMYTLYYKLKEFI